MWSGHFTAGFCWKSWQTLQSPISNRLLSCYKTTTCVHQNAGHKFSLHLAPVISLTRTNHKLPILIYHSHIKSQSTLSHFPYIFPFLCSDLQPSSHRFTVHLSTSLTLTVSSHCSSSHLHPDPFSSAQTHLWWQHPIDINDTTE